MLLSRTRTCKGFPSLGSSESVTPIGVQLVSERRQAYEIFKDPGDQHLPPRILGGG